VPSRMVQSSAGSIPARLIMCRSRSTVASPAPLRSRPTIWYLVFELEGRICECELAQWGPFPNLDVVRETLGLDCSTPVLYEQVA